MDRHRFIPWAHTLESRQLLNSFARTTAGLVKTDVPLSSLSQRMQRIDRLPQFLQTIDRQASIPVGPAVEGIQDVLRSLLGTMHATDQRGLVAMNQHFRGVLKQQTISPAQTAQLNDTFGKILLKSGANPGSVADLQQGMTELTRITAASTPRSAYVVANAYALVLQLALAVGKPLPAPGVPRIAAADDTPPKNDRRTANRQPTLVGTYEANTTIQIVDKQSRQILGSAPAGSGGAYRVKFEQPLAVGTHTVRIRAIGPQGALSLLSRPFRFTVTQAVPQGPRAFR